MKLNITPEEILRNVPQLKKLKELLDEKWKKHAVAQVVDDLMEHNDKYATDVKNAYLNEIIFEMADCLVDLKTDDDYTKMIEKYDNNFNEIYEELTRTTEYQITFTFEDAVKVMDDFPRETFLILKLVIRYINSYNLAGMIKSLGEPLDLNIMLFVTAFLENLAVSTSKEDDEKVIYIQDVVYHRSTLKNLPQAIKEELK